MTLVLEEASKGSIPVYTPAPSINLVFTELRRDLIH
jgi:hypothetical protein